MYLTVDIGNTRTKQAWFEGDRLVDAPASGQRAERAIVCATGRCDTAALELPADNITLLTADTPLPIVIDYATPQTLGPDRIAAACGARRLHRDTLIIDAGTCITIDFLDADGVYHGGAILPGIDMQLRALHTFTAKLPLVEATDADGANLAGHSTAESIIAGVLGAARLATEGFVRRYRQQHPDLAVMLTGGDAVRLRGDGKLAIRGCTTEPQLVMIGLNEILKHNQ